MHRLRQWSAFAFLLLPAFLLLSLVRGETRPRDKQAEAKPAEKWLVDRSLTVKPALEPVPAFKYRLFPMTWERKDGNAVPVYLRLAHERNDAWKKKIREKPAEWNKLPLDRLPRQEVKEFLDAYRYSFRQLELGARRKTAEWNHTLDAGDPIGLLLPDVQEMRMQGALLVLKARWEILEGRHADAIRTVETGISFSQQINEAPFLISSLVGLACASQFADCLLDLIERPDAPNLFWALAVVPRPLIDLRKANELEQSMLEMQFADMAELDHPRPPEEWDAALKRFRKELERIGKGEAGFSPVKPGSASTDPAGKSPDLPAARKYLAEVVGIPAATLDAMPPAAVLLRYVSHYYHELRDDTFKASYLPFPQTQAVVARAEKRLKDAPDTEAGRVARLFLPAIPKVLLAHVRIERRFAMLRVIEALRLHAAANNGRLPDKLDSVTVVPVPNDPGTDRPFEYQRDGESAVLSSRIPEQPLETTGLRYRVTLRK